MTANLAATILRSIDILAEGTEGAENDRLIPIHAIRAEVVAGRDEFDRTMNELRSNGLECIAISDNRRATQTQLDDSLPGVNETVFYVIV